MPTKRDINDFLAHKRIAFVGVSRNPKEFSHRVYLALKQRGYRLFPVNPKADRIEGDRSYPSVTALAEPVDGAMIMLQPDEAEVVVRQCTEVGIPRVWLGNGAVPPRAVQYAREHGLSVVEGACPLMFAEPVGFAHACHRFVKRIAGTLPK